MISETVRERANGRLEPCVEVSIEDSYGQLHTLEVAVDTGFTGWLTLPTDFIEQLGPIRHGSRPARLASGAVEWFDYYYARVLWHDQLRPIGVFQSGGAPLLGMQMLMGSRLIVNAWDGGNVTIEEAPTA